MTFTSIITTIISPIIIIYRFHSPPLFLHINALSDLVITLDIFTNFLCIILSFNHFDAIYKILCGCLHSKCKSLCIYRFKTKEENEEGQFFHCEIQRQINITNDVDRHDISPDSEQKLMSNPPPMLTSGVGRASVTLNESVYGSHLNIPGIDAKIPEAHLKYSKSAKTFSSSKTPLTNNTKLKKSLSLDLIICNSAPSSPTFMCVPNANVKELSFSVTAPSSAVNMSLMVGSRTSLSVSLPTTPCMVLHVRVTGKCMFSVLYVFSK